MVAYDELNFSYSRSSGAGGQNVNKVNSKVTLEWDIEASASIQAEVKARFKERYKNLINQAGVVQITSQESRSQKMNQDNCVKKLNHLVQSVLHPPKPRKKTRPKKSAIQKRLDSKKLDGLKKKLRGKIDF